MDTGFYIVVWNGLNGGSLGDAHGRRHGGQANGQWAVGDYVELMDGTMTDISGPCYDEQVPLIDTNISPLPSSDLQLPWEGEWRDVTGNYYGGT